MERLRQAEDIESYFSGYERALLTADELSLIRWNEAHFGEIVDEPASAPKRGRR